MAKFGELIEEKKPTLIAFYSKDTMDNKAMDTVVRKVAAEVGDTAKIVKIDISKNELLITALKIKNLPEYIIYKDGDMKWRQSGIHKAKKLIKTLKSYTS